MLILPRIRCLLGCPAALVLSLGLIGSTGLIGCGGRSDDTALETKSTETPGGAAVEPAAGGAAADRGIIEANPEQIETAIAEATPAKPAPQPVAEPAGTVPELELTPESPAVESVPPEVSELPVDASPKARLEAELVRLQVPPAWLDDVESKWDVQGKPWKEGRIEIRRLLGKGDEASRREGIRLMWDYLQKGDIGDGHEYGMYLFLGGEPLWAVHVYREWCARESHSYPPFFGLKALASLYCDYGVFEEAEKLLKRGLVTPPPKAVWKEVRQAEFHDALGDLYSRWGRLEQARASYQEAVRIYPLGRPPYGGHLLPRKAKKVEGKLRVLALQSLEGASLREGTYNDDAEGYSGKVHLAVTIESGRIADIKVQHQEKIDQNACVIIPKRIVDKQSLQVDGVTGATVTKDAIIAGTLQALQKAGLK